MTSTSSPPGGRLLHLDLLRGLAAQLVLVGHAYSLLVTDGRSTQVGSRAEGLERWEWGVWRFLELFTGRGQDAVFVFFVLSGLLVGAPAIRAIRANRFDPADYMLRRVARMYSVLLPALVLSAALVWYCFGVGRGADVIARNVPWWPADWPVRESMSAWGFVCNALFLQTVACPQFAHNSSLWSLANEFHYYLLLPALLLGFGAWGTASPRAWTWRALAILVVGVWMFPAVAANDTGRTAIFVLGFIVWMGGAAAPFLLGHGRVSRVGLGWLLVGMVVALLFYARTSGVARLLSVTVLAVLFIMAGGAIDAWLARFPRLVKLVTLVSEYSYSLYVIHVPVLFVLLSFSTFLREKSLHGWEGAAGFLAVLVGVNVLAYLFWRGFERHYRMVYDYARASMRGRAARS